jgi:hypothetical protein
MHFEMIELSLDITGLNLVASGDTTVTSTREERRPRQCVCGRWGRSRSNATRNFPCLLFQVTQSDLRQGDGGG